MRDLRCDNVEDGIVTKESSQNADNTEVHVPGMCLSKIRDDCMENDYPVGGLVVGLGKPSGDRGSMFELESLSPDGADSKEMPPGTVVDDSECEDDPWTIVWLGGGKFWVGREDARRDGPRPGAGLEG